MKKFLPFLGLALLILGAFFLWKTLNPPLTDEQHIARNLDGIVRGANNRSVGAIAGFLSPRFDFNGTKKRDFRSQLTGAILQYRVVNLEIAGVQIRVNGEKAVSKGRYTLNLKSEFQSPPETFRGDFQLEWTREEGEWKVMKARGGNTP